MNLLTKAVSIASVVMGMSCATPQAETTATDTADREYSCQLSKAILNGADLRVLRECVYPISDVVACTDSVDNFRAVRKTYESQCNYSRN